LEVVFVWSLGIESFYVSERLLIYGQVFHRLLHKELHRPAWKVRKRSEASAVLCSRCRSQAEWHTDSRAEQLSLPCSPESLLTTTTHQRSWAPTQWISCLYSPEKLSPYSPEKLSPYSPAKLSPYSSEKLSPYSPAKLNPYSPETLSLYSPEKLNLYSPAKLSPYSPEKLSPYSPEKLNLYSPEKLSPYSPEKLSLYSPEKLSLYSPEKLSPYSMD
jgi:hypothetical protein